MIRLNPVSETRERFGGISTMTEYRWRHDGLLPDVIKINGRNFDRVDQIDELQKAMIANTPKEAIRDMVSRFNAENASADNKAA